MHVLDENSAGFTNELFVALDVKMLFCRLRFKRIKIRYNTDAGDGKIICFRFENNFPNKRRLNGVVEITVYIT